jgi:hypothetical protein
VLEVDVVEGVAVGLILAPKFKFRPPGIGVVGVPCLGVEIEALRVKVEACVTRRPR